MNDSEIRDIVLSEIHKVAPDIDPADVSDDDHLQDDLELDSMDILSLVTALHERLGISIPEAEYPEIDTPAKAVRYLAGKITG
ncbi:MULTISPECIES: phosphopantetheine-binding protein [unclassified Aliiroseovarius]|uniref:acyl carrier protein n=1 Tax=unclassified Aliiroseovarius TaxID=2623558 RepID=UPI0013D744B4|nr:MULTISPECIES: phosphopantetheine-binding protein [unclassified Aliiroseovarius]MCK0171728.1 acyl carrier protein [Aliiroseovarius sp. S1123]NDW53840.1 acyl carrier protein [Aliiroseovarius sp. PrR006]